MFLPVIHVTFESIKSIDLVSASTRFDWKFGLDK
jgi:hypothetical protein